jgi:hypothetical protein
MNKFYRPQFENKNQARDFESGSHEYTKIVEEIAEQLESSGKSEGWPITIVLLTSEGKELGTYSVGKSMAFKAIKLD